MEYHLFWKTGPFCQWYQSEFTCSGMRYACAEQFMMQQKALEFGDSHLAHCIMSTHNPEAQKLLGQRVTPFDQAVWDQRACAIVKRGNFEKFSQNVDLRTELCATRGQILVEASPWDRRWGIGRRQGDPLAHVRTRWLGNNWLGFILTELREEVFDRPSVVVDWKRTELNGI